MPKKKIMISLSIVTVVLFGLSAVGPVMSHVEQPNYQIISSDRNIEIRQYPPMIIAKVISQGERKAAINQGFKVLADYIFGNNIQNQSLSMTAVVTLDKSEKIAMTAPVTQKSHGENWLTYFIMPKKYAFETLPRPNNAEVVLEEVSAKKMAVIRFSGTNTNPNILKHENQLISYLQEKRMQALSLPAYAFYNPPWTLPFLRRNEVMIEIE